MNITYIGQYERLRMVGLITGLVWAGFTIINTAKGLIQLIWIDSSLLLTGHIQGIVTSLVVFVIIALAWRRPFVGGVVLIVVWSIRIILSVVINLDNIGRIFEYGLWLTWVIPQVLSLLILVSGVLFLLSSRKKQIVKDETVPQTTQISRLHISGLIVGLVAGVMYMQYVSASFYYLVFLGASLVIFGSVALAWKRLLIGSLLLIIESLWPLILFAVSPLFPSSESLGLAMFAAVMLILAPFLCIPIMASGILFFLSWKAERRRLISDSN